MNSAHCMVLVTVPTPEEGDRIGEALLQKQLAGCINILPMTCSLYFWEGKLCKEPEYLLLIKTRTELFEPIVRLVEEIHPYELPEIIALPIVAGSAYLEWIDTQTGKNRGIPV